MCAFGLLVGMWRGELEVVVVVVIVVVMVDWEGGCS
jgi:hypothetical protein